MDDELYRAAMRYAGNLLSRRMYTESEIRDKLCKRGVEKEISDRVVRNLSENGYIDDFEYAKLYFEDNVNINAKGIYRISAELSRKGISRDIIEAVSNEMKDGVYPRLKEYVVRRLGDSIPQDFDGDEKLKAHLLRRGHSISDISKVLGEIKEEIYKNQ